MSVDPSRDVSLVRDVGELAALEGAWQALEARAAARGLAPQVYASHRYVSLAWRHLREPWDRLAIVVWRQGAELRAVWPLVQRQQRALGMSVQVLSPIGIWEGERPGILTDGDEDAAWAALWTGLWRERRCWHGLDLRELDADRWPVRCLTSRLGLLVQDQADTRTPWRTLGGGHEQFDCSGLPAAMSGLSVECASDVAEVVAAFERFLDLDRRQLSAPDVAGRYLLGADAARVALYREWLPGLASAGDAQVWLMASGGADVAAILRVRSSAGTVWLERHASEDPAWRDHQPAAALLRYVLARRRDDAVESDLLWPPDGSGRVASMLDCHREVRATRRLRVWNLRSRLAPMAWLRRQ